jgi:hypothetical protein
MTLTQLGEVDLPEDTEVACVHCPCGFTVTGSDEAENRWAYEGHDCDYHDAVEEKTERVPTWYEVVFRGGNVFWFCLAAVLITIVIWGK